MASQIALESRNEGDLPSEKSLFQFKKSIFKILKNTYIRKEMEWHQQVGRAGSPRPSFTPQTLIQQQFIDSLCGKSRDWLKAPCWVNAEPDSLKLVGRFRTVFCQSPCFWPRAMRSGKGSQCLASPRGDGRSWFVCLAPQILQWDSDRSCTVYLLEPNGDGGMSQKMPQMQHLAQHRASRGKSWLSRLVLGRDRVDPCILCPNSSKATRRNGICLSSLGALTGLTQSSCQTGNRNNSGLD